MSPHGGTGDEIAASGVPFDVGHTVVVFAVDQHEVGGKILLFVRLVTLVVEIVEVHIGELLNADCCDNHEPTSRSPVDAVAVLLVESLDQFEWTGDVAFGLLGSEEGHRCLGKYI